jgi:hypothetical protein
MKQKSVHEIIVGGIRATIWRNETNGTTIHNVTVSRRYKTGDNFKKTTNFSRSHLSKLCEFKQAAPASAAFLCLEWAL